MALVRTFVAVELSEGLKGEIGRVQQRLKKELGQLKWVPESNYHLTLKFLGDVESRRISELAEGLARAVKGTNDFTLGFAGVGGFPKTAQPRVVWIGVTDGREELVRLHKVVDQELQSQGFAPDKMGYSPHLTLARAREDSDLRAIGERLSKIQVDPLGADLVRSIKLMKSDLRPGGPIYTCLEEIVFA